MLQNAKYEKRAAQHRSFKLDNKFDYQLAFVTPGNKPW